MIVSVIKKETVSIWVLSTEPDLSTEQSEWAMSGWKIKNCTSVQASTCVYELLPSPTHVITHIVLVRQYYVFCTVITREVLHLSWTWMKVRHSILKMLTLKVLQIIPPISLLQNQCEKCQCVRFLKRWKAASLRCYQTFSFDLLTWFAKTKIKTVQIKTIAWGLAWTKCLAKLPRCKALPSIFHILYQQ